MMGKKKNGVCYELKINQWPDWIQIFVQFLYHNDEYQI